MSTPIVARANVAHLAPAYDSQGEQWWANYGALLLAAELGAPVVLTQYHPLTFHLPGGSYTPDFMHIMADGRLVVIEVKGSRKQPNYRDARSKLRAAQALYPWATWYEARIARQTCEALELIGPA